MSNHEKADKEAILMEFLLSQNVSPSPSMLEIYSKIAERASLAQVAAAIDRMVLRSDDSFKPTPQKFRKFLFGVSTTTLACEQWEQVMESIRKIGPWKTVCFSHPVTNKLVAQMGWADLNSMDMKQLTFAEIDFKKRFVEEYELFDGHSYPSVVLGMHDKSKLRLTDVKSVCTDQALLNRVIEGGVKPEVLKPVSLNLSQTLALARGVNTQQTASLEQ